MNRKNFLKQQGYTKELLEKALQIQKPLDLQRELIKLKYNKQSTSDGNGYQVNCPAECIITKKAHCFEGVLTAYALGQGIKKDWELTGEILITENQKDGKKLTDEELRKIEHMICLEHTIAFHNWKEENLDTLELITTIQEISKNQPIAKHAVLIYKQNGKYGAIGQSKFKQLTWKRPRFKNLHEMAKNFAKTTKKLKLPNAQKNVKPLKYGIRNLTSELQNTKWATDNQGLEILAYQLGSHLEHEF